MIFLVTNSIKQKSKKWSKFYLKKYFKSNSKTRFVRRCNITNRNRSVLRSFGFSRIVFRNFIHHGFLPGYKKAVW